MNEDNEKIGRLSLGAIALLLVTALTPLHADADASGTWHGVILVDPGKVEVELGLSLAADGSGEIWFPTQGPTRHALSDYELADGRVAFTTVDPQGIVSSFAGELAGDTIRGELSEQGMVVPFELRRQSAEAGVSGGAAPDLTVLAADGAALRDAFNRDRDKVRVVTILSPTCGVCRMGARLIENYLFDRFDDPRLAVYVVWEPQLEGDDEAAARDATFFLASERATHYWSQNRFAGRAYQPALGLENPAWDVFLVFAPGARWDESAPAVDFYMHKLQGLLPDEHLLDATVLARKVDALLSQEWAASQAR